MRLKFQGGMSEDRKLELVNIKTFLKAQRLYENNIGKKQKPRVVSSGVHL